MRTFGLIPAAGKSRRMGRPKLTLPIGDSTVLECVLRAVQSAGVADILVVAAPGDDDLARLARNAGAHFLQLSADTPDMRTTVLHGLDWLETAFHPAPDDGWLLLPADHPTVRPDVVRSVLEAGELHSIVVPTHEGKRGHPTWFRWSHVQELKLLPADVGLNAFIRTHANETHQLPWATDEILRDLDTPEDYVRITASQGLDARGVE